VRAQAVTLVGRKPFGLGPQGKPAAI